MITATVTEVGARTAESHVVDCILRNAEELAHRPT